MNAIIKYFLHGKQRRLNKRRRFYEEHGVVYPGWQSSGYHRPVYPDNWDGPRV